MQSPKFPSYICDCLAWACAAITASTLLVLSFPPDVKQLSDLCETQIWYIIGLKKLSLLKCGLQRLWNIYVKKDNLSTPVNRRKFGRISDNIHEHQQKLKFNQQKDLSKKRVPVFTTAMTSYHQRWRQNQ